MEAEEGVVEAEVKEGEEAEGAGGMATSWLAGSAGSLSMAVEPMPEGTLVVVALVWPVLSVSKPKLPKVPAVWMHASGGQGAVGLCTWCAARGFTKKSQH